MSKAVVIVFIQRVRHSVKYKQLVGWLAGLGKRNVTTYIRETDLHICTRKQSDG